jgi:RIO-like serine/threonine protein kinase
MANFKSITVTKGEGTLEINNPTKYPLIGHGSQGAVFKLSENRCVKIYENELQAAMEAESLLAGKHLSFMPKVYETGSNYIVMDYFSGPTLKEYLKNSMYMSESMAKKLLSILKELKQAGYTMVDAPLRHIFVVGDEELKVIDHVNAFKRNHPVPIKLLRELNLILLKDCFLLHVEKLEPEMYQEWEEFFNNKNIDYRDIAVESGESGSAVNIDSSLALPLVGAGHQGAVYRVSDDKCVKIYPKVDNAKQEQKVLLSCQHLPFIPKVFDTDSNYVLMEYLFGPDLNSFLKKQRTLPEYITKKILEMLKTMKAEGFKQIDAPLRHTILTVNGLKLIDHVYSFTREQDRPLELFKDLYLLNFLDTFLEQVKEIDPETYNAWTQTPIPPMEEQLLSNYTGPHINDKPDKMIMTPEQIVKEILLKNNTSESTKESKKEKEKKKKKKEEKKKEKQKKKKGKKD